MSDDGQQVLRIHDAFRRGDLKALRAAVDDPSAIPNGLMPVAIGSCLVYAIYHSPIVFIRALLDLGANPNPVTHDGFPSLVAALASARGMPGARTHAEIDAIIQLLLRHNADVHQRGINDYTPLHMAVAERNAIAIQRLLDAGADPDLRTRIDACETPLAMAEAAGLTEIAEMLTARGHRRQPLRPGLTLLADAPGAGEPVRRLRRYRIRLRLWLNTGEPVRWVDAWGPAGAARLEDERATLFTEVQVERRSLIAGLYHGIVGMRVGGLRRLEIAAHLAYGARGVSDVVPANAVLVAEIMVLDAVDA